MEKKTGTVIQAKFLEEYKPKDTTFYTFGVAIKYGNNPKIDVDSGLYYSTVKDQKDFVAGQEVEYTIKIDPDYPNDKKKSRIKPYKASKSSSGALGIEEYIKRKIVDAVSFSASYAKDVWTASGDDKFEENADKMLNWQINKLKELL